jgi:hypothetical protein
MSARVRRLAFAVALATAACNAIVGNDAIHYVDEGDGGGVPGRADASADARDETAGDAAGDAGDATFDAGSVPPCSQVSTTRFCADFDPPAAAPKFGFTGYVWQPASAPTTVSTSYTTGPFALDFRAPYDSVNAYLVHDFISTGHARWDVDVRIVSVPDVGGVASNASSVDIVTFQCGDPGDTLVLRLDGSQLSISKKVDGGFQSRNGAATLPLGTWIHVSVNLAPTTTITLDAPVQTISFPADCSNASRVFVGLTNGKAGSVAGNWQVLFDSARLYP